MYEQIGEEGSSSSSSAAAAAAPSDSPAPETTAKNLWDQVDDFNWLQVGPGQHSPNWDTLPAEKRILPEKWKDVFRFFGVEEEEEAAKASDMLAQTVDQQFV